jgi:hypothetical protein
MPLIGPNLQDPTLDRTSRQNESRLFRSSFFQTVLSASPQPSLVSLSPDIFQNQNRRFSFDHARDCTLVDICFLRRVSLVVLLWNPERNPSRIYSADLLTWAYFSAEQVHLQTGQCVSLDLVDASFVRILVLFRILIWLASV